MVESNDDRDAGMDARLCVVKLISISDRRIVGVQHETREKSGTA
jgi:hypothetical protein